MKSRVISIILSLVMCATMFPLQVVAETLNEKYTESVSTVSQNSIELTQKSKDLNFTTPATMNIDLWVNGEEITPENAETAVKGVSYDVQSNTLTLNNAYLTTGYTDLYHSAVIFSTGDLNINLVGENTIKFDNYYVDSNIIYSDGIFATGVVTIEGSGSLDVYSVGVSLLGGDAYGCGFATNFTEGDAGLVVNSGTVYLNGEGTTKGYGVYIDTSYNSEQGLPPRYFKVNGGTVILEGGSKLTSPDKKYASTTAPDTSNYNNCKIIARNAYTQQEVEYEPFDWGYCNYDYIKIIKAIPAPEIEIIKANVTSVNVAVKAENTDNLVYSIDNGYTWNKALVDENGTFTISDLAINTQYTLQVKEDAEGADIAELDFSTTNSITVTYNGNGDGVTSVPEAQTETDTTGKYFTIASAEGMKKEGYTFIKWQTETDSYLPGDEVWFDKDITLYAYWAKNVLESTAPNGIVTYYPTLQMAFEQAPSGSIIKVLEDYTDLQQTGVFDDSTKDITLDLNGHRVNGNLTISSKADDSTGKLTITGNGTLNGTISYQSGGLTIENGTFGFLQLYMPQQTDIILNGGTFIGIEETGSETSNNKGIYYVSSVSTEEDAKSAVNALLGGSRKFSKDAIFEPYVENGDTIGTLIYWREAVSVIQQEEYSVSGVIKGEDGTGTISIYQNGEVKISQEITVSNGTGSYSFVGVPDGVYNLVVNIGEQTVTILIEVDGDDLTEQNITMPKGEKNSVVDNTTAGSFPATVGGLDEIAQHGDETEKVVVILKVEEKEDVTNDAEADAALKQEQTAIKNQAEGKTLEYIDLQLIKVVDDVPEENFGTNNTKVLEIIVPFDFTDKYNITVYRYHDGAEAFKELTLKPLNAFEDGTFYLDKANNLIHIYAMKFSTYAIGYDTQPDKPSGGSSGGGSESETYYPFIEENEHGSVSINTNYPEVGSKVTITPNADDGYIVGNITVTDRNGNKIDLTDNKDGTYTFEQPYGSVTISVDFIKEDAEEDEAAAEEETVSDECPRDETCVMDPYLDLDKEKWYHDGIHFCIENGIMYGIDENIFAPDDTLTRAMMVTMLWNLEGSPEVDFSSGFSDVKPGVWYEKAADWAVSKNIVYGYGNAVFGGNDPLTREQMASMLYRYAKEKGYDTSAKGNLGKFVDSNKISDYALEAMRWATGMEIINGTSENTLDAFEDSTRAQVATMLMNFVKNIK